MTKLKWKNEVGQKAFKNVPLTQKRKKKVWVGWMFAIDRRLVKDLVFMKKPKDADEKNFPLTKVRITVEELNQSSRQKAGL